MSEDQFAYLGDSDESGALVPSDQASRLFATDPRNNVVLEASAGTGKTSVLVGRYVNLLRSGVNPANVLAITFTRQAAAEMRGRIISQLRKDSEQSPSGLERWTLLRDRLGEISISTVDAFCLSLLREYPLEADLDPGFNMAEDTEVPRLVKDAVDRTMAIGTSLAIGDSGIAMLLAQLGPSRTQVALTSLLERRLVVPEALRRFLSGSPLGLTGDSVSRDTVRRLSNKISGAHRSLNVLIKTGPVDDPVFTLLARDLTGLGELTQADSSTIRASLDRMSAFFLTQQGTVRKVFTKGTQLSGEAGHRFKVAASELAPLIGDAVKQLDANLNFVRVRAVQRLFGIAVSEYRRCLDSRALIDFSDVLERSLELMRQMDEFARSRYRLESRYHHVLVDEFQDTSRAQWELVSLLVQAWGEGSGVGESSVLPPSIFIVGDRKQAIYRFRDADVSVLTTASSEIAALRPDGDAKRAISHSFRAVPSLLAFANDLFNDIGLASDSSEGFSFKAHDQFPNDQAGSIPEEPESEIFPLGVVAASDIDGCAEAVAEEIERLLVSRSLSSGEASGSHVVNPGDIAVLFRARASHSEFKRALERRSIATYVYKGLGFFEADEVKDIRALVRFLSDPASDLRAAALLRSRFAGVSDIAIVELAGRLSDTLTKKADLSGDSPLPSDDLHRLVKLRNGLSVWLQFVDRMPPAELLDLVLHEAAYAAELQGRDAIQARENVKKVRGLVRRLQNRGYATMARISDQIDHLADDMSPALVESHNAVHFMTVHAAKGLEFPVVFLIDIGRGTGSRVPPVSVIPDRGDGKPSVSVWPFRTSADAGERQRELGETKRLLYVAVTRARERLYLSAVVRDGKVTCNRGSFGEVLPNGMSNIFERAVNPGSTTLDWKGSNGRGHRFQSFTTRSVDQKEECETGLIGLDDLSRSFDIKPVTFGSSVKRRTVTGMSEVTAISKAFTMADLPVIEESNRVVGRVVHKLIERFLYRDDNISSSGLESEALQILRGEPSGFVADYEGIDRLSKQAVKLYTRLRSKPDVEALGSHNCLFEIPFSYYDGSNLLTGIIDCLARAANGSVTVLEFKTGPPHPSHHQQLSTYIAAAQNLVPGVPADGYLVYP